MTQPSLADRARSVVTNVGLVTAHQAGVGWQRAADRIWGRALILCYHRVAELDEDPQLLAVQPRRFEEQLERLRQHFTVLPLRELVRQRGPRAAIALTFDDGYRDNLSEARPRLEHARVPATIYVTTGYTDGRREFWWDELERVLLVRQPAGELRLRMGGEEQRWSLSRETERRAAYDGIHAWIRARPTTEIEAAMAQLRAFAGEPEGGEPRPSHAQLTEDDLRELDASSMVEIGAHTVTHPSLAAQPEDAQRREIVESGRQLERWLRRRVGLFSYPFGGRTDQSSLTRRLVKQAGYDFAVANFPGQVGRLSSRWQLPRILVRDWSADELEDVLRRAFGAH
jgi:peptidoglycan/xylan/chitin deacetylase (PgdA/CDA1 family)